MGDPFRSLAATERFKSLALVLAIVGLMTAAGLLLSQPWAQGGARLEGEVEQFGVIARKPGNQPIVKVRLANGSEYLVLGSQLLPNACRPGDQIELFRNGKVVTLGPRGCHR